MAIRWKAWALGALVVAGLAVALDDLRLRQERRTIADLTAFSRAYRACTDKVDAEYYAKIDAEPAQDRQRLGVERPDYAAFIARRVACAR